MTGGLITKHLIFSSGEGKGQLSPLHPSLAVLAVFPLEQCSTFCNFKEARHDI